MRSALFYFTLLSLAVHLAFWFVGTPFSPAPREHSLVSPVLLERIREEEPLKRARQTPRRLSMSDLMVGPQEFDDGVSLPSYEQSREGSESEEIPSATSVLSSVRDSVLLDYLYKQIDSSIHYPRELKDNDIEGLVKAELELRRDPKGVKVAYRVDSSSPFLRVFVIQRLRHIFRTPVMPHYVPAGGIKKIRCHFHFELTRVENAMETKEDAMERSNRTGIRGNYLSFYRGAKVIGQWKLGPIAGYAIVPSIGIDLEWIENQFRTTTTDSLAKYRNDPAWQSE